MVGNGTVLYYSNNVFLLTVRVIHKIICCTIFVTKQNKLIVNA